MLRISYDRQAAQAVIECSELGNAWADIRNAFNEAMVETSSEGPLRLRLSWWEFLLTREAIGHAARRHGLQVELDEHARANLKQAASRVNEFREAGEKEPLSEEEVTAALEDAGFSRRLTSHQLRNVRKLAALDAAATFSVPGAGKTTEALAYWVIKGGFQNQLLVVAPKNAFAAWEEQLLECFDNPAGRFARLTGGRTRIQDILIHDRPKLALITYHQLSNVRDLVAMHVSATRTLVFLDESHRMKKGAVGKHGQAVLSLSHLPVAKLILSGTPMPHSSQDLVPQFDFLYPEIQSTAETVTQQIQSIYVRTTKDELGIPPASTILTRIDLSPGERALYDALRSEEARSLMAIRASERHLLRRAGKSVVRLLQAVSNPMLLSHVPDVPNDIVRDAVGEGPTKLDYVCDRARRLAMQDRKVVIWSSFIDSIETISSRLEDIGADYIHGGVAAGEEDEDDTREAKIREFHDNSRSMVLVANPAACSEGISLHTVCHDAIYLDRTYNAAQYLQSRDRIHRLGLPSNVKTKLEIVIAPNTIDELVHNRLGIKIDRMATVLNDSSLRIEEIEGGDPDDESDLNIQSADIADLINHLKQP